MTDSSPKVSVVLISRNHADWVGQAVESVLGQTHDDLELLIFDNQSTDESPEILAGFTADPRVRLQLCDWNAPVAQRLNQGVVASKGEFVSFLYSDDYYLPEKLERQLAAIEGRDESWGCVYGRLRRLNQQSGQLWDLSALGAEGWIFESIMRGHRVADIDMCTPLTRRSALQRHPFNEDYWEAEAIFLRIALTHRFLYVDDPLVVMRDHSSNAGKDITTNAETVSSVVEALRANPEVSLEQKQLVDHYAAGVFHMYGWSGSRLGADPSWVRQCFRRALADRPALLLSPKTWIGLTLSLIPQRAADLINAATDRLRPAPQQRVIVEGSARQGTPEEPGSRSD